MTEQVATLANAVIAGTYLAISIAIGRGLWRSRQWRSNRLGTATAAIFFTCAVGHGLYAVACATVAGTAHQHGPGTGADVGYGYGYGYGRFDADVLSAVWGLSTAMVGVWYWTLRGRFPALVRGAAVFEDLRPRQAAEQRLRVSERRYRGIVEATSEGVVLIDGDGRITYANDQFATLVGRAVRDVRGAAMADLVTPEHRGRLLDALHDARELGTQRLEVELRHAGDHAVYAQVALTRRHDACDGLDGTLAMVADVTGRRAAEAQLRQAQRLDAVGHLAGGVAHDFNNLLTVIDGYAAILLSDVEGPARQDVAAIRDAAARATALTRQLLAFSSTQANRPESIDVNDLIVGLEEMLHRLIPADIHIVVRTDATPATVWADRGQLDQVLINLAVNSRDAMPDGGQLTISTRHVTLEPDAADGPSAASGHHVLLTVADTGCGIPDDVRELIFEPFFTTKERGRGTGLGLSMVYGIVGQAGGHLVVDSAPGVGTDVRVYLPATAAPARPAPSARDAGRLVAGRGTVLLVEDDPAVRELGERILLSAGYDVLAAEDGERALALAADVAALDILITDLVMPGLNGRQLADRLGAPRPDLPVLFISAYSRGVITHRAGDHGVGHLEKPFTAAALTEKVREMLTGRAPRRPAPPPTVVPPPPAPPLPLPPGLPAGAHARSGARGLDTRDANSREPDVSPRA
jgi:PAS domain S-box-containing protein